MSGNINPLKEGVFWTKDTSQSTELEKRADQDDSKAGLELVTPYPISDMR